MSLTRDFRDAIAVKMLGDVLAKTAGELTLPSQPRTVTGWVYVGRKAFFFVADQPVFSNLQAAPDPLAAHFFYQEYSGCRPATLTAPRFVLNGIVDFGPDGRLLGAKTQMRILFEQLNSGPEA